MGTTQAQITQRFGKPTLSGFGVDRRPSSWAIYIYTLQYMVIDTDFNSLRVFRASSATLNFDDESALRELSLHVTRNSSTRLARSIAKPATTKSHAFWPCQPAESWARRSSNCVPSTRLAPATKAATFT